MYLGSSTRVIMYHVKYCPGTGETIPLPGVLDTTHHVSCKILSRDGGEVSKDADNILVAYRTRVLSM
jgi:hypothetical protein